MGASSVLGVWQVVTSTNPQTTSGDFVLFQQGDVISIWENNGLNFVVTRNGGSTWWGVPVTGNGSSPSELWGNTGPSFSSFFEVAAVDQAPSNLIMGSVTQTAGGTASSPSSGGFLAQSVNTPIDPAAISALKSSAKAGF